MSGTLSGCWNSGRLMPTVFTVFEAIAPLLRELLTITTIASRRALERANV